MKTVKEVVDEYKARQTNCVYKFVKFEKYLSQPDGYCLVKNVYRDGVKLDTLNLDTEYHKYEFESGWSECYLINLHQ